jgi:hypothetical protein
VADRKTATTVVIRAMVTELANQVRKLPFSPDRILM